MLISNVLWQQMKRTPSQFEFNNENAFDLGIRKYTKLCDCASFYNFIALVCQPQYRNIPKQNNVSCVLLHVIFCMLSAFLCISFALKILCVDAVFFISILGTAHIQHQTRRRRLCFEYFGPLNTRTNQMSFYECFF